MSKALYFDILTLFPRYFDALENYSLISKAIEKKTIQVDTHDIRKFGRGKHKQVDDRPFGGGPGMVLKPDVLQDCLNNAINAGRKSNKGVKPYVVLLDPSGTTFRQKSAEILSRKGWLILICGHYEGIDDRIKDLVDVQISIGDYVLGGGEPAALVLVDTISRLVPGFLGKNESAITESFSRVPIGGSTKEMLDHPSYTRPEVFEGKKVPKVLLSGNHQEISKWRFAKRLEKTKRERPDLLKN
jgi:tRNA (guanine37-N1)-methyltransferase